jgi:ATP-dependent DNA helicase RecG
MNLLETLIEKLPGTSAVTIRRFKSLGIGTYFDLLNYFPFRFENYSIISSINQLQEGEKVTVKGQVLDIKNEYTKRGFNLQKAILYDKTGKIDLVWYNQPYLLRVIRQGSFLSVAGEVKKYLYSYVIQPEEYEILNSFNDETIHTGRIIPIYPEKRALSSKTIREKVWYVLKNIIYQVGNRHACSLQEFFPPEIISYNNLIDELSAYQNIHFPSDLKAAKQARQRLAFDEIFTIQLSSKLIKREWQEERVGHPFKVETHHDASLQLFINHLPFQLTNAQKRCVNQIINDLVKPQPMNRLLQGDVGSGKTVVAAAAAYLAYLNGFKTLFMAPTEILAQQHYQTLSKMFKPDLGISNVPKVCLYTSSSKPKSKSLKKINIIVGTHALIAKKAIFDKVCLVIIDEQHKFGVAQRVMLKQKGINPHLLTMTATPIPRTVALTLYGELDLSLIDEMPPGRFTTKTFLVPKKKRNDAYCWIKKQIKNHGVQVFIICPLIEESDVETMRTVKAAKEEFKFLKDNIFNDFKLGLLHGKMKSREKDEVMKKFAGQEIDILISTAVVEVGIDVPNATIIIIETAERFGLAQLHQLRGRVGRSTKQSYCFLFTNVGDSRDHPFINKRLNIFTKINNGFDLAEYDLKIRGVGEIYGTKQHGIINLKIASLSDFQLIERVNHAVGYFSKNYKIKNFPKLQKKIEEYRISVISRD